MEYNINKVYINPNFGRTPNTALPSNTIISRNYFHVNPHFSRNARSEPQNYNLNRKIYVNPHFIKTNNVSDNIVKKESESKPLQYNNIDSNCTNTESFNAGKCKGEHSKVLENIPTSKYRLVRNNENKVIDKEHGNRESCTIKISKYKSIPIHYFKSNLQIPVQQTQNKVLTDDKQSTSRINVTSQKYINNTFKLIRHNPIQAVITPLKLAPSNVQKKKLSVLIKLKTLNCNLKKYNIPCRLFAKYGKCLRNESGTCEYLHDKKHVSLCRKFIKGICHDKNCLLSHEFSSKKMPTCYFYLKGMCVRDDCPYLHVKLNEKSKICHDFLKGYCDKGEMCAHKHIRPRQVKNIDKKYLTNTLNKHTPKKIKLNISKRMKVNKIPRNIYEKNIANDFKRVQDNGDGECRYFKEGLQNEDETCEVLKPLRCKLGTLPSYIQL